MYTDSSYFAIDIKLDLLPEDWRIAVSDAGSGGGVGMWGWGGVALHPFILCPVEPSEPMV